jgi:hypothetical protein
VDLYGRLQSAALDPAASLDFLATAAQEYPHNKMTMTTHLATPGSVYSGRGHPHSESCDRSVTLEGWYTRPWQRGRPTREIMWRRRTR